MARKQDGPVINVSTILFYEPGATSVVKNIFCGIRSYFCENGAKIHKF